MSDIPAEKSRWRRIALPASVILNLFLLAVIGGHVANAHRKGVFPRSGIPLARALARAEATLPPKDAAAFGAVISRDEPHFAKTMQELRQSRQKLDDQLVAEHFDPAATRQALGETQVAWDHFLNDFSGTLVDALAQVSPEGRRKLISETQIGARVTPGPP
jgi:uncharacterized membrane protein